MDHLLAAVLDKDFATFESLLTKELGARGAEAVAARQKELAQEMCEAAGVTAVMPKKSLAKMAQDQADAARKKEVADFMAKHPSSAELSDEAVKKRMSESWFGIGKKKAASEPDPEFTIDHGIPHDSVHALHHEVLDNLRLKKGAVKMSGMRPRNLDDNNAFTDVAYGGHVYRVATLDLRDDPDVMGIHTLVTPWRKVD